MVYYLEQQHTIFDILYFYINYVKLFIKHITAKAANPQLISNYFKNKWQVVK